MRAHKWRKALIGPPETIRILRETNIPKTIDSEFRNAIKEDLRRTYPENRWFTAHIPELSDILNLYAYTNNGMGYAQGMAFMIFILFKVYHDDNSQYAVQDTYYSFHRIMTIIRPIYPLHQNDLRPTFFKDDIKRVVYLQVAREHRRLAKRLKEIDILPILIYQTIPTLFANKFNVRDTCILFDFIFVKNCVDVFHRVLCVLSGIIISFRHIILGMTFEKVMQLIQERQLYNVRKIIAIANKIR